MKQVKNFLQTLERHYELYARDLPWRTAEAGRDLDPYKVLVSEIMLQQTQVNRVIPKYNLFLSQSPTIQVLASSELSEVLTAWAGLGYNRRAKYLYEAAKYLANRPLPWNEEDLITCKGIGTNTARAVLAYAYNRPVLFLETNIKTVIIHHFFADRHDISDKEILAILQRMIEQAFTIFTPRELYWAMMDYGTFLKSTVGNLNRRSKGYIKQSPFHGSSRQIRGKVIRRLTRGPMEITELRKEINDERFDEICRDLVEERMLKFQDGTLMLYNNSKY